MFPEHKLLGKGSDLAHTLSAYTPMSQSRSYGGISIAAGAGFTCTVTTYSRQPSGKVEISTERSVYLQSRSA